MKGSDFTGPAFFIVALAMAAILSFTGISWGLPSEYRARLLFSSMEAREEAYESMSEYLAGGEWRRSHANARDPEVVRHRATPNIIRSFGPDEQDIIKPLASMRPRSLDFNPHRFIYPAFMTYMVGAGSGAAALLGQLTITTDLGYYFANPGEFGKFFIVGRVIVVCFGLLSVKLTYALGSRLFSERIGGLAALLLAVTPIWAIDTHYLKVDIPGTFWILLAIYFSVRHIERRRLRYLCLAGLASGLAAGTKYNFGIVILTPVLSGLSAAWREPSPAWPSVRVFVILGIASLAAFLAVNPYIILSFGEFRTDFQQAALVASSMRGGYMTDTGLPILYYFFHAVPVSFGMALSAASAFGLITAFSAWNRADRILASFAVPFAVFLLSANIKLSSYLLPLIPIIMIWTARGLDSLGEIRMRWAGNLAIILVVASAAWASAAEVSLFTGKNTRDIAAEWIHDEIPPGSTIGLLETPLAFKTPSVDMERYRIEIIDEAGEVASKKPEWFVVTEYWTREYDRLGLAGGPAGEILREIESGPYEPVARIARRPRFLWMERPHPEILPQDWYHPAPEVRIYRRTGSTLPEVME